MGCNASTNKFERGPQETYDKAKPNNESKEINQEDNEINEEVTDEREESYIEETGVAGDKLTVPWFMNNGLVIGSSKSPPSEDNARPGNGMKRIRQPFDRNVFELDGILGAQAVLVEDTVARESRVPARDGPA